MLEELGQIMMCRGLARYDANNDHALDNMVREGARYLTWRSCLKGQDLPANCELVAIVYKLDDGPALHFVTDRSRFDPAAMEYMVESAAKIANRKRYTHSVVPGLDEPVDRWIEELGERWMEDLDERILEGKPILVCQPGS